MNTGDAVYWQGITGNVLSRVVESGAKIWPLLEESAGAAKYVGLGEALFVSLAEDQHLVQVLLKSGIDLIKPTKHIADMIQLMPKYLEVVKMVGRGNVREQLLKVRFYARFELRC